MKPTVVASLMLLAAIATAPLPAAGPKGMKQLDPAEMLAALDLSRPGLEKVQAAAEAGDNEGALKALLDYYRRRDSVWYPVEQALRVTLPATKPVIELADGALDHVLLASTALGTLNYAPHDYGADIHWDADPYSNRNWLGHIHRYFWDDSLASAYLTTHDDKYAAGWISLAGDWIRKNPVDAGWNRYSYGALQVGVRSWRWCADFELYKKSPSFTPDFLRMFLAAAHDQAQKTTLHPDFRPNNGTIVEALGLISIGVVFPEFKQAENWRKRGLEILEHSTAGQVTADGVHREWGVNYHMGVANWLIVIVELLKRNPHAGPETDAAGRIEAVAEKMCDWAFAAISPDRQYPMFSDARRPSHNIVGFLRGAAEVFDKPHYTAVIDEEPRGYPKQLSYGFGQGGMYFLRSGWDREAIYMGLHCSGPATSSHDQPDNGTFELYAFGRWLMPDSGCYAYGHGQPEAAERNWFRQTAVHQTLTLDGKNSVNAAKHLLMKSTDGSDVVAFENASYPGLTHRRTVFFVDRSFFVLVDEAIGTAKGALDLHFQLAPGAATVKLPEHLAHTNFPGGGNVLLWQPPDAPIEMLREKGQVSFEFHRKEPRPAFAYRHLDQAPAAYLTAIVPYRTAEVPSVSAAIAESFSPGDDRLELTVTLSGKQRSLGRDLATGDAWCR